jgi:selenoprotein W-related protein
LASRLLTGFKQRIREFTLVPSGGGCFEVTIDGELVYSKLKSHQFPDEGDISEMVEGRLAK